MKNKKLAGFTLVECIVAIAILSIGTLVMASIYACVAQINEKTHRANESLGETIQRVETKSDKGTTPGANPEFTVLKGSGGTSNTQVIFTLSGSTKTYTMQTNVYVIYSQDTKAHNNTDGTTKHYSDPTADPIELRYKYFAKSE